MPKKNPVQKSESVLRDFALTYPETHEDFPWGHRALKVKKKTFTWLVADETGLSVTVKLPLSGMMALQLPFANPTGYGLGESGWVSAHFAPKETPPLEMLKEWIDESYRAVAPKKLVASLDGDAPAAKPVKKAAKKPAAAKRATKAKK
jgi:predicted DNA-binding protein (MmcQ/YjbR family)